MEEAKKFDHPIVNVFSLPSPYSVRFAIWLANAIDESSKWAGNEVLRRKLKNVNEYSEAISVLEIAWKFSRFGFKLSLGPTVPHFDKKPDIKLTDEITQDVLFVEVSGLHANLRTREALRTHEIVSAAIPITVGCLGALQKGLSEQHSKELARRVRQLAIKVRRTHSFHQMVEQGVIEIAMAPDSDWKSLVRWARARRLPTDGFSSPDLPVGDEILRTALKIQKEQQQLPPNRLGLVVLENNHLFLQLSEGKITSTDILRGLEESVFSIPNLFAVAVFGTLPGPENRRTVLRDQHVLLKWNRASEFVEYCAILHNRFCNLKMAASTVSRADTALRFNIIP